MSPRLTPRLLSHLNHWRRPVVKLLLAGACAAPLGCSRAFWREQADVDVYQAIGEKVTDMRWASPRLDITPDPRSRFFDPYNPDYSPLPPDDPAAHAFMHCVDGWEGYGCWHCNGDRLTVENPTWLANYGITPANIDPETGAYVGVLPALEKVTLQDAVELSQIHSRDYQLQLENVYLSALAVTFQRFQFGVRYLGLGGNEPSAGLTSAINPHGPPDSLNLTSRFGISQLLPAGGQIAVELANNTLWLFEPESTRTASTLSYSLVQPLLFGAGRKVVLESLTQVERNLLYALRDLAQFRKQFFTDVVGGNSGFLGLMQTLQSIRNQEDNIRRTERRVAEMQAISANVVQKWRVHLETPVPVGEIPESLRAQLTYNAADQELIYEGPLTVEQEEALRALATTDARKLAINELIEIIRVVPASLNELQLLSSLTSAQNRLRNFQVNLQNSLDNFKIQLGLPTDMPIGVDDSLLEPFEFIDPELRTLETDAEDFVNVWGQINGENPDPALLRAAADFYQELASRTHNSVLPLLDADVRKVAANMQKRLVAIPSEDERNRVTTNIEGDKRRLENLRARLATNLANFSQINQQIVTGGAPLDVRTSIFLQLKTFQEDLLQIIRGLEVVQIGLRVELIDIQPYERSMEESVRLGLENRVDLMNDRANVMDSRRKVEIAANQLQAALNLVVQGDFNNRGPDNPVDFRADLSQLRFGLQFTAPLDQIDERNAYRTTLIIYQQARRAYMLSEDQVKRQIRADWRGLELARRNLETSRLALRIAALQFDSAVEEANQPAQTSGASRGGSGASQQGINLLNALQSILVAQESMISTYVDYERSRLNIHRDMGIMDVGPDGIWNDPFYRNGQHEDLIPPALPGNISPWYGDVTNPGGGFLGGPAAPGGGDEGVLVGDGPFVDGLRDGARPRQPLVGAGL